MYMLGLLTWADKCINHFPVLISSRNSTYDMMRSLQRRRGATDGSAVRARITRKRARACRQHLQFTPRPAAAMAIIIFDHCGTANIEIASNHFPVVLCDRTTIVSDSDSLFLRLKKQRCTSNKSLSPISVRFGNSRRFIHLLPRRIALLDATEVESRTCLMRFSLSC